MSSPSPLVSSPEPQRKVFAFFDCQNLFFAAKREFGSTEVDFDPQKLAESVCATEANWKLEKTYFYTGLPDSKYSRLRSFWANKINAMKRARVEVYSRPVVYRWEDAPLYGDTKVVLPNDSRVTITDTLYFKSGQEIPKGSSLKVYVGREKGIDIKIGVDVIRFALQRAYDVALIFSQDNDLSPVAEEIRLIAKEQSRWIKVASAYPYDGTSVFSKGIDRTDWKKINRTTYEACKDLANYWPK